MPTMEELLQELAALKKQVERQNDINEIQKVMAAYEYLHYPITFPEKIQLFALDLPDVSFDVGDSGEFVGREGIETKGQGTFFSDEDWSRYVGCCCSLRIDDCRFYGYCSS